MSYLKPQAEFETTFEYDVPLQEAIDAVQLVEGSQTSASEQKTLSNSDRVAISTVQRCSAVRRVIRDRSDRTKLLPSYLFADPAWDMLLDLYLAELEHQQISVSSLCIASNVPATTALRWIKTLQNEGLVSRASDQFDARRFFLSLTEVGLEAMNDYFAGKDAVQELSIPDSAQCVLESAVVQVRRALVHLQRLRS